MLWIEPSAVCNLRCPGCPTMLGHDQGGVMSLKVFQGVLERIPVTVRLLNLWHRGEPLAAPDFPEMVAAATKRIIRTHTHTNGILLTHNDAARRLVEARLTQISIAIDGADEATYQAWRPGGSLKQVALGIKALAGAKRDLNSKHPYITVECLVGNQPKEQFARIKELALKWGANTVKFKTLRINDLNNTPEALKHLPENHRLWRYDVVNGRLQMKRTRSNCARLGYSALIAWNGDLFPCCFYLKGFAPMGNLYQTSFKELWNTGQLAEFRQVVNKKRDRIPMCRNCTEGLPNLYIDPLSADPHPENYLSKLSFFGWSVKRILEGKRPA
jgi:radical SAM protein with 4Fe4S-binding SPASM domain